jgi:multiple sugar transport system substrate-binding protein
MDVLYYNADWLRQLGYTSPPQDWKQFEEMACKAVDRGKGKSGWAVRHDATNFATLVLTRGGRVLSADGKSYAFNSSEGVDSIQMIQRMAAQGCAVQVSTSERFGEETRFANGQVLFVLASSVSLPYYADSVSQAGKFKWDIALPPNSGKPVIVLSGASLNIHKTTPEKELAAWLVIKFLSEKAQTVKWADETGYLPVRQSAQADLLAGFRKNKFYSPVVDLFGKLFDWLPSAMGEPPVGGYDSVRYSIDRDVMSKALADPKADAATLLDAAVKKANDTIK